MHNCQFHYLPLASWEVWRLLHCSIFNVITLGGQNTELNGFRASCVRTQQSLSCLPLLPLKTECCGLSRTHLANRDSVRRAVKSWPASSRHLRTFASRSNGSSERRLRLISALFISRLISWTLTGADWRPGSWNTEKNTCPRPLGTHVYQPWSSKGRKHHMYMCITDVHSKEFFPSAIGEKNGTIRAKRCFEFISIKRGSRLVPSCVHVYLHTRDAAVWSLTKPSLMRPHIGRT